LFFSSPAPAAHGPNGEEETGRSQNPDRGGKDMFAEGEHEASGEMCGEHTPSIGRLL
jgi:hypothetical protein